MNINLSRGPLATMTKLHLATLYPAQRNIPKAVKKILSKSGIYDNGWQ